MSRQLAVIAPPPFTLRFVYGVLIAFVAFLIYLYVRTDPAPGPQGTQQQLMGTLAGIAIAALLVGLVVWAVHRRSLELSDSTLTIKAGFYSRSINRASLRLESARVTSLFDDRSIAPRWRTNGIRVPGFHAGWFRLANGDKALVLLTDPRTVTYVPTIEGFALLISTSELLPALGKPAPHHG